MVTFIAKLRMLPGKEDEALARAQAMFDGVRDAEPGVPIYLGHRSQNDPQVLVFFEVYADKAVSDAHSKTPHFAKLVTDFDTVFDAAFGVQIEYLDRVGGVVRA